MYSACNQGEWKVLPDVTEEMNKLVIVYNSEVSWYIS